MKKITLLLFSAALLFLYSCSSSSDQLTVDLIPFQIKKDGKVSLMRLNGEIVLSDEFSDGSDIFSSEGIILETKSDKVNYYRIEDNKLSQITLDKNYESGTPFFNGFALVRDADGRLGFIEKSGKEVLSLASISDINIVRAGIFSDGLIKVKSADGYWGFIDIKGKVVIKPEYAMVENFVNGKARVQTDKGKVLVIDKNNEKLFTGKEDFYYFPVNGNDELVFVDNSSSDDYAGLMKIKGETVIKDSKFKEIRHLTNSEYFVVKNEDKLWGVINKEGEYVGELRAKFEQAPIILKDGFAVIDDEKLKLFDKNGESTHQVEGYVLALTIDNEHVFAISEKRKTVQIIDINGKELLQDNIIFEDDSWFGKFLESRYENTLGSFENMLSLESTYFDFDNNFKAIFSSINESGIWNINNGSNILTVDKAYKGLKAKSTVKKAAVKADRSLNFSYVFYSVKESKGTSDTLEDNGYDSGESAAVDSIAVDSTAVDETDYIPDSPEPVETKVKDPYSFIGLYQSSYNINDIHIGDISLSATAYFTDYLKNEVYGLMQDPVFKETYSGLTGYELNPEAKLRSISVSYSLDDYEMNKKFAEKLIEELEKRGWSKGATGNFVNAKSRNSISISAGQLIFNFN